MMTAGPGPRAWKRGKGDVFRWNPLLYRVKINKEDGYFPRYHTQPSNVDLPPRLD